MPKIKTKTKYKHSVIAVDLNFETEKILSAGNVTILGQVLKSSVINFMLKGVSPVTGTRFALYKDVEKYPKNARKQYPDKRNTPVNLKLSGDLHNSLGYASRGGKSFVFGILNPIGNVADYANVHNAGERSDIPQRKFLPAVSGEEFNKTIMLELRKRLVNIIKVVTGIK